MPCCHRRVIADYEFRQHQSMMMPGFINAVAEVLLASDEQISARFA